MKREKMQVFQKIANKFKKINNSPFPNKKTVAPEQASQKQIEKLNILEAYVRSCPSNQNILDIFSGEWASKMPDEAHLVTEPGFAGLFEDSRIIWLSEIFGSFEGKQVLELGPLEGGHSYMLHKRGAANIDAVESNTRAFLKCLCIKEIFGLQNVNFMLGDFNAFLEETNKKYEFVVASGVLYHMSDPIKLLRLIAKVTDKVMIWTHYYDESVISSNKILAKKFSDLHKFSSEGIPIEWAEQSYREALDWQGFCGGSQPTSKWLTRQSILNLLASLGFSELSIKFEKSDHPNGPCFAICAAKQ